MHIYQYILFIVSISAFFWWFHSRSHRTATRVNALHIGQFWGRIFGSTDEWIDAKAMSFQIGFASFFFWHLVFIYFGFKNITFPSATLALFTILLVQTIIKRHLKRSVNDNP